jgi:hypothetical protein
MISGGTGTSLVKKHIQFSRWSLDIVAKHCQVIRLQLILGLSCSDWESLITYSLSKIAPTHHEGTRQWDAYLCACARVLACGCMHTHSTNWLSIWLTSTQTNTQPSHSLRKWTSWPHHEESHVGTEERPIGTSSSNASQEARQVVGTYFDHHPVQIFWENDSLTMLPAYNTNIMVLFSLCLSSIYKWGNCPSVQPKNLSITVRHWQWYDMP